MRLRLLDLSATAAPEAQPVEVPPGWVLLDTLAISDQGAGSAWAVLQEIEPSPNLAQLLNAAVEAPAGTAVGIPSELLREAMREVGYDVPEPSPIRPATEADVHNLERPRRPIKDNPQA